MPAHQSQLLLRLLSVACLLACLAGPADAAKRRGSITRLKLDPKAKVVDLFKGTEQGVFAVRVSPRNEFESNVYITNTTGNPLTVSMPKAVAAVQILKQVGPNQLLQFDGFDFGSQNDNAATNSTTAQDVGGTVSPLTGNGFPTDGVNNLPGNIFFSIPPEQRVRIRLNTVCLNYGKRTPSPRMQYVLRRLEDQTKNRALRRLLESYDPKTMSAGSIQAAAWHLSSKMSWKALAAETRGIGVKRRYFSDKQLKTAKKLVANSEKKAARKPTEIRVAEKASRVDAVRRPRRK